jgi:hypothetical protein
MIRLAAIAGLVAVTLSASVYSAELPSPQTAAQAVAEKPVPSVREEHAAVGDTAGGRYIPKPVLDILADPHIDPNVAYMLWQLSRRPVGDWTISELSFVAQLAPTMLEADISVIKIQTLYQFWGLDTNDIFNVSLAPNWQSQSTAFSTNDAGNVAAISSAECQVEASQMTVSTFKACTAGRQ